MRGQLFGQARFADARLARDQKELATARKRLLERGAQLPELLLSADEEVGSGVPPDLGIAG